MAWNLGYTPVGRAQSEIAQTIKGGLAGLGQRDLDESRMGLEKAAMNRQIKMDELKEPILQLESQQARDRLNFLNSPVDLKTTLAMTLGPKGSRETALDLVANDKITPILKATGATLKDGILYQKDGNPVLGKDIPRFAPALQAMLSSGIDPGHALNQKLRELGDIEARGGKLSPEQAAWRKQAEANKKDPNWLLNKYSEQNQKDGIAKAQLAQIGVTDFSYIDGNIARRNSKSASLQASLVKRDERRWEKEKLEYERKTKEIIQGMKNDAKDKTLTPKKIQANNALITQHIVGKAAQENIQVGIDDDGNATGLGTQAQIDRLSEIAGPAGFTVYKQDTGEVVDMPGLQAPWNYKDDNETVFSFTVIPDTEGMESKDNTVNTLIDKYLPKGEVVKPKIEKIPAMKLQSSHETELKSSPTPAKQKELSEQEAIARAKKLRGESKPIKIKLGKRKPGTPRP